MPRPTLPNFHVNLPQWGLCDDNLAKGMTRWATLESEWLPQLMPQVKVEDRQYPRGSANLTASLKSLINDSDGTNVVLGGFLCRWGVRELYRVRLTLSFGVFLGVLFCRCQKLLLPTLQVSFLMAYLLGKCGTESEYRLNKTKLLRASAA